MINWTPDTSGIWRPENIDNSTTQGIEWLTKYQIIRNLSLQFAGTVQNAKQIRKEMVYYDWVSNTTEFDNVKRQQAFTPILTLSSDIDYKSDWGSVIDLNCKYTSSRINYYPSYDSLPNIIMQTKILPQHVIFSLSLNQKLVNIVNIILKIDNIFNVQYSEQFGNSIIDKNYPRPGRTIFVGINIKN
jgi:outer membrane receptor for ferrienterochelin and colicin